ncbi:hypothetical protein NDU88_007953 [Pleurodeles waltl]|uniref:Uncharacterized protein n=1 Tax=Pleurodeles waltl TaxID=8319 RepID=A0AAV7N3I2_PLEWA|nr:hypothetical protein NDU88_007953 [Pleurodeles waltl]
MPILPATPPDISTSTSHLCNPLYLHYPRWKSQWWDAGLHATTEGQLADPLEKSNPNFSASRVDIRAGTEFTTTQAPGSKAQNDAARQPGREAVEQHAAAAAIQ